MRAEFQPTTLNEQERTIDVTWTTGHKGLRRSYFGDYYEELDLSDQAVDMSHLRSGRAKFLASHDMQNLDSVLGVIAGADIGRATVRLSKDEITERHLQKIRDGILTDVSVGYRVDEYTDVSKEGDTVPTYRATRWTPIEISLVPQGFDPGAVVRSEEINENEVEFITRSEDKPNEGESMKLQFGIRTQDQAGDKTGVGGAPVVDTAKLQDEATKKERARVTAIRNEVRTLNLDEKLADELIERGISEADALENIRTIAKYTKASAAASQVDPNVRIEIGQTEQEKKARGLEEALLFRVDSTNFKPSEMAQPYIGKSLLRMVEEFMGRKAGESDAQFATRAMSSSDLPLHLANVAEKAAQKRYDLAERTWTKWAKTDSLRNYKEKSQVRAGDFASLQKRKESGEFQRASINEEGETVQLEDYGIVHAFTRRMLINDDLKVIQKLSSEGGVASARLENKLVYAGLSANPTMGDGVTLFHATHKNLGTTGAISETTVAEMYKLMRKQLSVGGLDPLNLKPRYFICGPDKEVEARKFFASIIPNQTSNVNIFQQSMEVIVDAELTGNQYYMACDPSQCDTVTLFRLEGEEKPRIESRINWETEDLELKVAHAAVAQAMDFRGLVKNVGA